MVEVINLDGMGKCAGNLVSKPLSQQSVETDQKDSAVGQSLSSRKFQSKKRLACLSLEDRNIGRLDMNCQEPPEEILASKWECDRLMKGLNSMDIKHRTVVVLRYFNELSYDEIAQVANIPLGTVKSRINQALKYIRQQMSVREEA